MNREKYTDIKFFKVLDKIKDVAICKKPEKKNNISNSSVFN